MIKTIIFFVLEEQSLSHPALFLKKRRISRYGVNNSENSDSTQKIGIASVDQKFPDLQTECSLLSLFDKTLYSLANSFASFESLGTVIIIVLKCVISSSLDPIAIFKNRLNSASYERFANHSATCAGIDLPHFLHWRTVSYSDFGSFFKNS